MTRGAMACWDALLWFCNGKEKCWPSWAAIATRSRYSRRSVGYHLKELRDAKAIRVEHRPNRTCFYYLNFDFCKIYGSAKVALPIALPDVQELHSHLEHTSSERESLNGAARAKTRNGELQVKIREWFGHQQFAGVS